MFSAFFLMMWSFAGAFVWFDTALNVERMSKTRFAMFTFICGPIVWISGGIAYVAIKWKERTGRTIGASLRRWIEGQKKGGQN